MDYEEFAQSIEDSLKEDTTNTIVHKEIMEKFGISKSELLKHMMKMVEDKRAIITEHELVSGVTHKQFILKDTVINMAKELGLKVIEEETE